MGWVVGQSSLPDKKQPPTAQIFPTSDSLTKVPLTIYPFQWEIKPL